MQSSPLQSECIEYSVHCTGADSLLFHRHLHLHRQRLKNQSVLFERIVKLEDLILGLVSNDFHN